jgi:hypothetical protein
MRKTAIGLFATEVAASLVLGACSSSSKSSSSTGVATPEASTKISIVPSPDDGTFISVAPAAGSDPRASAVVALLRRHFTDIKEGNFTDYFSLYTPKYRATLGDPAKVAEGYRSTVISDIRLTQLSTLGDGRPAAIVTFTSKQDAADGPDGQTCTRWTKGYFLSTVERKYLIDFPPTTYNTKYVAC